nr:hypothetical protein GCM10020063_009380 [Dactylosporangium thailandense]
MLQEHGFGPASALSRTRLAIDVREQATSAWVTLLIGMLGVRDWRVVDVNTFSWVLFADPHLVHDSSGLLHVDFDTTIPSDHRTPAQMASESHLYWSAKSVSWLALPHQVSLAQLPALP